MPGSDANSLKFKNRTTRNPDDIFETKSNTNNDRSKLSKKFLDSLPFITRKSKAYSTKSASKFSEPQPLMNIPTENKSASPL